MNTPRHLFCLGNWICSFLVLVVATRVEAASGKFAFARPTFRAAGSGEGGAEVSIVRTEGADGTVEVAILLSDGPALPEARTNVLFAQGELTKFLDLSPILRQRSRLGKLAEVDVTLALGSGAPFDAALGEPRAATLVLRFAPMVFAPPRTTIGDLGDRAALSMGALGAPQPAFQWMKGGAPIAGQTHATFALEDLQLQDAGLYTVFVANPAGSLTRDVFLAVNTAVPPKIIAQPQSQTRLAGEAARFDVGLRGATPFRFQWHKDGLPLAGATNQTIEIESTRREHSGRYAVAVANAFAWTISEAAALNVEEIAPIVTEQPLSQTNRVGTEAQFEISIRASGPVSFQWLKDGRELSEQRQSSLMLTNVQFEDAGAYTVRVSNPVGAVTSLPAILTVIPARPVIVFQPLPQYALFGTDAIFFVEAQSVLPLAFQWHKDGQAIAGATKALLLLRGVKSSDAGSYSVSVIDSQGGATLSRLARLIVLEPPSITVFSASQTVPAGTNVLLRARATGTEPLEFQWFKDAVPIAGETGSEILLQNVQPSESGDYHVAVKNAYGMASSSAIRLTVSQAHVRESDFDGDDRTDIVFQDRDGFLAAWLRRDSALLTQFLMPGQTSEWRCAGSGDMDGDGAEDLVFQHTDGTLAMWFMRGLARAKAAFLEPHHPGDRGWLAVGIADFNRDNKPDLLFQHTDGTIAVWQMDQARMTSAVLANPSRPPNAEWRVGGLGDFNQDGSPDLVLQHSQGGLTAWAMEGTTQREVLLVVPDHPGEGWRLVGAADLNGDAQTDLLFQHERDGTVATWLLRGTVLIQARLLSPNSPGGTWRVATPR